MRRVPRVRRPSGLSSSFTRSSIVLSTSQHPHQPTASQTALASHCRPVPACLQSHISTRFYSAHRQPVSSEPGPVTEAAKEEYRREEDNELNKEGLEAAGNQHSHAYAPPPRRSHAERSDEVSDPSYIPAMTADGLETVGGLGNWWDKQDHWSNDFVGFKPTQKVLDPAVIEATVRQAIIEAFALRQAGREDELVRAWPIRTEELGRLMEVAIHVEDDGAVSLSGDVSIVLEALNQENQSNFINESTAEGIMHKSVLSAEKAREYSNAWGHGWKAASLSDTRIKFAVSFALFRLRLVLYLGRRASN
ncbi:hypothetical protein GGR53DRAFT_511395 [Hypoxylon sp. FL1150]|nr:hypothetical protein GGR53DRAFT_511395 [Hypoxylon sp. FL1150]